jgi:hypothetical protein
VIVITGPVVLRSVSRRSISSSARSVQACEKCDGVADMISMRGGILCVLLILLIAQRVQVSFAHPGVCNGSQVGVAVCGRILMVL